LIPPIATAKNNCFFYLGGIERSLPPSLPPSLLPIDTAMIGSDGSSDGSSDGCNFLFDGSNF